MIPPIARNFIGGEDIDSVVEYSSRLNKEGITPILNYLGEHYTEMGPVTDTVSEYTTLLSRIDDSGITAEISLKPTQLGLLISKDTFRRTAEQIVSTAAERDIFVWFDMEKYSTADDTINVVSELQREYSGSVGVCLQANIRKTERYLTQLCQSNGETHIRLVKGAYNPPEDIAFTDSEEIDSNYIKLVEQAAESVNGRIAIGSHDESIIQKSISILEESNAQFEVQMLMGVREDRQRELAGEYDVSQYVPYGPQWMSYTYRRIRENPLNILFVGRAVLESFRS